MDTTKEIQELKKHFGTYKATSEYLGVSYDRYHRWVRSPEIIPSQGRKLIELAAQAVRAKKQ